MSDFTVSISSGKGSFAFDLAANSVEFFPRLIGGGGRDGLPDLSARSVVSERHSTYPAAV